MLPLSKLHIPLNQHSTIANKLTIILAAVTLLALYNSSIYWLFDLLFAVFIIAGLVYVLKRRAWVCSWDALIFEDEAWHLQSKQIHHLTLDSFKEVFASPLFSVFTYQSLQDKGQLIIFRDQISQAEYHAIILMLRIL